MPLYNLTRQVVVAKEASHLQHSRYEEEKGGKEGKKKIKIRTKKKHKMKD